MSAREYRSSDSIGKEPMRSLINEATRDSDRRTAESSLAVVIRLELTFWVQKTFFRYPSVSLSSTRLHDVTLLGQISKQLANFQNGTYSKHGKSTLNHLLPVHPRSKSNAMRPIKCLRLSIVSYSQFSCVRSMTHRSSPHR
jgi:hypothetical protein